MVHARPLAVLSVMIVDDATTACMWSIFGLPLLFLALRWWTSRGRRFRGPWLVAAYYLATVMLVTVTRAAGSSVTVLWVVVAAVVVAPLVAMYVFLAPTPRHPAGCCDLCGYDLRGTPGRCPECGEASASRHHVGPRV